MGIEISGNNGRPAQEALDSTRTASSNAGTRSTGSGNVKPATGPGDRVQLSDQAAQLQALEAKVSSLPVVDTQRVQDVQRTLATGSFEIEPARVADKMLRFESGLSDA
jgi:negative regulator of flagellin synthesis FlgM